MKFKVTATGDSLALAAFPADYIPVRKTLDEFFKTCDIRLTNLETTVSDFEHFAGQYSGGTWLSLRRENFKYLESFGFDFYGTANNHCMDYSYGGLLSTIDFLDERGHAHAGTGRSLDDAGAPAFFCSKGKKIAVIAVDLSAKEPSMAGRPTSKIKARPGVNYLRHKTFYRVSEEQFAQLKRIAQYTSVNFSRNQSVSTGYIAPDEDGFFTFGTNVFTIKKDLPKTKCDEGDLKRVVDEIKNARKESDYVFIYTHCHDSDGIYHGNAPQYLIEFGRAAIDSGANAVFGAGCHQLRGMCVYKGCPIFYSMGDFIFQLTRIEMLPADFTEKYGLAPDTPVAEAFAVRSKGGKVGLQFEEKNFMSIIPEIVFDGDKIESIKIKPVKLGFMTGGELEGLPYLAEGAEAERILGIFAELSKQYGTNINIKNGNVKLK